MNADGECWACGCPATGRHGIPIYEDEVLPNSWPGEWGGVDACGPCYRAQQELLAPVPRREFVHRGRGHLFFDRAILVL